MQEKTDEAPTPHGGLRWEWTGLLSFATALVAVGSATLHLVGSIWHRNYLAYWGIDSKLFPQSTDQVLLNGFYALFDRLVLLFWALGAEWHTVLLVIGTVIVAVLASYVDVWADKAVETLAKMVKRGRLWRARVTIGLAVGLLITSFAIRATFVLVVSMGDPAAAAETAAKKSVDERAEDFARGCDHSTRRCAEIRRVGQEPIVRYLLETSPSQLAIFDVDTSRSRALFREGAEIISARPISVMMRGVVK